MKTKENKYKIPLIIFSVIVVISFFTLGVLAGNDTDQNKDYSPLTNIVGILFSGSFVVWISFLIMFLNEKRNTHKSGKITCRFCKTRMLEGTESCPFCGASQ